MPVSVAPACSWDGETGSRGGENRERQTSVRGDPYKSSVVVKCVLKGQPVHHPSSLLPPLKPPPEIPTSTGANVAAEGSVRFRTPGFSSLTKGDL